jgi:Protein of unknown function (DUF1569)
MASHPHQKSSRRNLTAARTLAGMKHLFNPAVANELKARLQTLRPDSPRQWGRMTPAQALAHCSASIEMALGDFHPPRKFIGRLLGPLIKPLALRDDEPMRKNSPTIDEIVVQDDRDLAIETSRLRHLIDRFATTGPSSCTTHPHSFFGPLTPDQWSILMYKHLDHHLRQFGA